MMEGTDGIEEQYVPFIVNRGLSQHQDCILLANEMNYHNALPKRLQYDFLKHIVRAGKRYGKWAKAKKEDKHLDLVMEYYNVNRQIANQYLDLMGKADIKGIEERLYQGG